jgi:hypothetical protein
MHATRLLFWNLQTSSGLRRSSDVKVREDLVFSPEANWGNSMYRVAESVRSMHGQDGAVVLDIRQGQMFNLNLVGSQILELLEKGVGESEIVAEIIRKFGVSREVVEADVREFIASLEQHHLLEVSRANGHH